MDRYLRTFIPTNSDRRNTTFHVGAPFFECISVPGLLNGVCGGCQWRGEGKSCDYANTDKDKQALVAKWRASADLEKILGPGKLNDNTAPVLSRERSGFEGRSGKK